MKKRFLLVVALLLSVSLSMVANAPSATFYPPGCPYLTKNTVYVPKAVNDLMCLGEPSEGIFSLQEQPADSWSCHYSFYSTDGQCLFSPEWESPGDGNTAPRFDSGAVMVKRANKNAAGNTPLCILYANGMVRELPVTWQKATQFFDGVAKVYMNDRKDMRVFYINTKGEHIWTHLDFIYDFKNVRNGGSISIENGARYVCCGMRAYFDNKKKLWGYLDAKGQIAIPAQYADVRDFANGYALVIEKVKGSSEKPAFIDKTGKVVCYPAFDAPTMQYAQNLSDVSEEGIYRIQNFEEARYYNLAGEQLFKIAVGTPLVGGYAFVCNSSYGGDYRVVNSKWETQRTISSRLIENLNRPERFVYSPCGVVTMEENCVFTNDGELMLSPASTDSYPKGKIGKFNKDGLAKTFAKIRRNRDGKEFDFYGITNINGELLVVFNQDPKGHKDWDKLPPVEPEPINPPKDTIPKDTIPPGNDTLVQNTRPPIGPKHVTEATYTVKVVANPAEGGTVSGGGTYKYGDVVTVHGKANKNYVVTGVKQDNMMILPKVDKYQYEVRGDGVITVTFSKVDEEDLKDPNPGKGIYEGVHPVPVSYVEGSSSLSVYLEMSGDKTYASPYGDKTGGVLAVLYDPNRKIDIRNGSPGVAGHNIAGSLNLFALPMKVMGITKTNDGKQWLIADGGQSVVANLVLTGGGGLSPLAAMWANLAMSFSGFKNFGLAPAHYRIEMLDVDEKTGEFTFGKLERYSVAHGWVPGKDPRIAQTESRMFVTKVDAGLDANYLYGVRMKVGNKRKIEYMPPESFYLSKDSYQRDLDSLGEIFGGLKTDVEQILSNCVTEF